MQQNNALPAAFMANAMHYNSQQSSSLLNTPAVEEFPVSGAIASMKSDSYNQLSWGMPYTTNFFTPEAYGIFPHNVHHPGFTMQIGQSQFTNDFDNNFYPSFTPVENKFLQHASPDMMLPNQAYYPCKVHDQEFDYFVVIDLEATCDKEKNPYPQEIIEFPSVLVNSATGQLEASFQTYVRPAYHHQLTDFCKELTGIQQVQVDKGVLLSEAILMHDKWLEERGIKHKRFAVVTWSDWDCRVMLESECTFKGVEKPTYFNRWINLRVPFQQKFGGVRYKLQEAVQLAGLTWEGRAHCGLDDARNTARLLVLLMQKGTKFSITNSLMSLDQIQEAQKLAEEPAAGYRLQFHHHHPSVESIGVEQRCNYCFCGALSNQCIVRKPGPNQGRIFFSCGNWTPTSRASCKYFEWASP